MYELKNKKETARPKLEIKGSSRKDKYDLVFEDDSDEKQSDGERRSKKMKERRKVNVV